jgi:hypothetical protein
MPCKKVGFLVFVFTVLSVNVFAGPFGLDMGMTLAQVKSKTGSEPKLVQDDLYEVDPPNKNNLFEQYLVRIHKTYGVYMIKAVGKDIETNGYGIAVKTTFDQLLTSIEKTYGKYKKVDQLLRGSIWDDPDDWMMALRRNERFLFASWDRENGSTLPSDLKSIAIAAAALSASKGYVSIDYYSMDYDKVDEEKKASQDSVF